MIGIILVTHGNLGQEFISALEHVVAPQENILAICIGPHDDVEQRRSDILQAVYDLNTGEGVVILTDMFGGTPSNLAMSILDHAPVEVIAGVNLPMLVKLAAVRKTHDLHKAATLAHEAAKKYITVASLLLAS